MSDVISGRANAVAHSVACPYRVAEARADFDAILSSPETTGATRQWIEQLKVELPAEAQGATPQASTNVQTQ